MKTKAAKVWAHELNIVAMIERYASDYMKQIDDLIGQEILSEDLVKGAINTMKEIAVQSRKVQQLDKKDLYILYEIVNHLWAENLPDEKRFITIYKKFPEFLLFLMVEICNIVNRIGLFLSASLWHYHVTKKNIQLAIKLWKSDFEYMDFIRTSRRPLLVAVQSKSIVLLNFILNKCKIYDYNQIPEDDELMTLFMYAVAGNDTAVVKTILMSTPKDLISKMINARCGKHKLSALHIAAENENLTIIKLLCEYGGQFNIFDAKGNTAANKNFKNQDIKLYFDKLTRIFLAAKNKENFNFKEFDVEGDDDRSSYWSAQGFESGFTAADFLDNEI